MPFGQPGMMGAGKAAMGMNRNKMMQNKQQQAQQGAGIGPSMGAMGSMMGNKMGQQAQKPGMRMGQAGDGLGQMAGAMGQGLGRFQQQRQIGKNRQIPMQPRQDMYEPPQIGMSSAVLQPEQQPAVPEQSFGGASMEPVPQMDPRMMQEDRMQQALASYGPKSSLRRGGIGPRFA